MMNSPHVQLDAPPLTQANILSNALTISSERWSAGEITVDTWKDEWMRIWMIAATCGCTHAVLKALASSCNARS